MIKKIKTQTNKTFFGEIEEKLSEIFFQLNIFQNNLATKKSLKNLAPKETQIAVALSGGCDSLALFILLLNYCKDRNIKIHALTVDHKIRANSGFEASELKNFLKKNFSDFDFCHNILEFNTNLVPKKNIEAKLRELRYDLLTKYCQENKIKFLFLGHQLNDIAENFLIRLFRGSSIDGLSSINEIANSDKLFLIRPLLNFTKITLQDYLISKNITWFEDQTNSDEKFLRNKIRNFLKSFDDSDLLQKRIKNTADYFLEMRQFFEEKVNYEMRNIVSKVDDLSYIVNRKKLALVNQEIAQKIIAKILLNLSKKKYMPRRIKLESFVKYLISDKQLKPRSFCYCLTKKVNDEEVLIYLNKV